VTLLLVACLLAFQDRIDSLRTLIQGSPRLESILELNRLYGRTGQPDSGIALLVRYGNIVPVDQRSQLAFQLAEDYLYAGRLSEARETYLMTTALNPGSEIANDALERVYLVELGRRDTLELKRLLAVLADEAYGQLDSVPQRLRPFLSGTLSDIAYYRLGRAAARLKQYPEALAAFAELRRRFPEHTFHQVPLFEAEINIALGNSTKARSLLEAVIIRMPASIYAARAREMLKALRP
jgi:tetratricopeptide (TPR) repeat protein